MKTQFIFLFLLLSFWSTAQNATKTRTYEIRSNIPAWPSGILGERVNATSICGDYCIPPYGSRFAVVRYVDSGGVVIRFLNWSQSGKDSLKYYTFNMQKDSSGELSRSSLRIGGGFYQRYFRIRRADLDSNCMPVYARGGRSTVFTLGLVTMPLKLRLGSNFDFQGSFSLGTTAGAKMRISEYNPHFVNFLVGASISTVTLDSFSTRGKVSGQPLTNIATFSPSLGMVFEFGRAQAGVFYGWDFLSKSMQSKYGWIHNRKPWISVGFGFSIFNIDTQTNTDASKQK